MANRTTKAKSTSVSSNNAKLPVSSSSHCYHVETLTDSGSFNFFTEAENHKKALRNLELRSWDFRKLVKADRDMVITVKLIK